MTPLIEFDLIVPSLSVANFKQLCTSIAKNVAPVIGIKDRILQDRLIETEKKSPSCVGGGVAMMHLQVSGLQKSLHVFIQTKSPVAMRSPDGKGVDLVCLLLTPEREGTSYLQTLSRLSRTFKDPLLCDSLRKARGEKEIGALLNPANVKKAAA